MNCGAFDSGLTIHPDGKATPCCKFDINLALDINSIDLTGRDPWQDLRDGAGCNACRHNGATYKDRFDNLIYDEFAIRLLDVRNNNLCNLECSICSSYYSSKWADRLGAPKFVSTDFDVDLSKVEIIYFAGGEPLLNPKHWEILDSIPNPERVNLLYNSNLVSVKNIDVYWPRFKRVFVNASMDAVGPLGEYLRYGTRWDKWEANLHRASEYATITVNPTISVLNIFHLQEIEKWSKYPISYNILTYPDYLCVSVLPAELKNKIEYIPDNLHLKQLLTKDESWLFPHSMSFILLQDKIKNTDVWNHLPFNQYAIKQFMKDGI